MNTVGKEFQLCKPSLLLDVLIDTQTGWDIRADQIGSEAKSALYKKLTSTLALMDSIYQKENIHRSGGLCHPSDVNIIVPWEWFSFTGNNGEFLRRMDARILNCLYLDDALRQIDSLGGKMCSAEELQRVFDQDHLLHPLISAQEKGVLEPIFNLVDIPWKEALSFNVWFPPDICQKERYCVLANIFWAMTYNEFPGIPADRYISFEPTFAKREEDAPIPESFDQDYQTKMIQIANLLNYNCWVDSICAIKELCNAA